MSALPFGNYGFTVALYVISIMVAVSGISLGIGYAFNERRFKDFGREELYQSIINGALVGGLIALFSSGGMVGSLIGSLTLLNGTSLTCSAYMSGNPALCLSYDYLAGTVPYTFMGVQHQSILSMTTLTLTSLFGLDAVLGVIASVNVNLVIVQLSFNYVLAPILSEIQYIIKILSTIAISALVQASVISFIAVGALSLILPAGLILRSFYPTRKLGGFLTALSIGLYVVLPLSYVFNIMLVGSFSSNTASPNINQLTLTASGIEGNIFSFKPAVNSTQGNSIGNAISGALASFANSVSDVINQIFSMISYFIVYTFILPAFSLIVTGISVKELAEVLGSEAYFGRFSMLG